MIRFGLALFVALLVSRACARADRVVVVCPASHRSAMDDWCDFRESQGRHLVFIEPTGEAESTGLRVRQAFERDARVGEERCVVLVGDGASCGPPPFEAKALVIQRWGPERTIPTDLPYADSDADGKPDASVGRLPFASAEHLARYLDKVIHREQTPATHDALDLRLVASPGGFSPLVDAAVETTARTTIDRLAPATASLSLVRLAQRSRGAGVRAASDKLATNGGIWVYLGHGLRHRLAGLPTHLPLTPSPGGLGVAGRGADAAILIACYAGAFERREACFSERLLDHPSGPVIVVAATRVSAPYGNAVIGANLLRVLGEPEAETHGEALLVARRRAQSADSDPLLAQIGSLAQTLSGGDEASLRQEAIDHARMYTLLGDPLLRVARPSPLEASVAIDGTPAARTIEVTGVATQTGDLRVRIYKGPGRLIATRRFGSIERGRAFAVSAPIDAAERTRSLRALVSIAGPEGVAATSKKISLTPGATLASRPGQREGR